MKSFTVDQNSTLLDYLFRVLRDTKKTRIKQWLKFRCISVNGVRTTQFNHPLKTGDQVSIRTGEDQFLLRPALDVGIVFEDDFIVVAHKPSGLLSIATEKIQKRTAFYAVNEYLNRKEGGARPGLRRREYQKPRISKKLFIVHRLDKDTSGLMVFAKDEEVKFRMQEDWAKVTKKYYAVVEGAPGEKEGTLASYLRENTILRMTSSPKKSPDAKYAITHYRVLQTGRDYSLLEIDLETGRKHQIRVHMAKLGCPVAGDKDYGGKTNPANRLALHACFLAFEHPVTGERMEFRSVLPPPLKHLLETQPHPL
ncbi:MAG TPA: RluA family pseudouridine synthase [bacterium]|nr:RluA family pseudouridine synthase [bacterium]